jgi:hypothetical protein
VDNIFNVRKRNFRMKFKTGNTPKQEGASDLFTARRAKGLCSMKADINVLKGKSNDKGGMLGHVRNTTQVGWCEKVFRNRFNKKAQPLYDVVDSKGDIAYTVLLPVEEYKLFGCLCTVAKDMDYLAIVKGPRNEETRFGGAELKTSGWVVPVEPRYAKTIEVCIAKANSCLSCVNYATFGGAGLLIKT